MASERSSTPIIAGVVLLLLVLGGVWLLRRGADGGDSTREREAREARESASNDRNVKARVSRAPSSRERVSNVRDRSTTYSVQEVTTAPVQMGMVEGEGEPEENSKTAYLVQDFRGYQTKFDGYKVENVEMTHEGVTLPAGEKTDEPRIGVLESPPLALNHASNMVAPLWRAEIPEGTAINVEVQISPDNNDWSQWYPVEPTGDEILPFYPDGRPNPNYGAVGGTAISEGLKLYPYVKYRVTLSSGVAEAPVLQEMRMFHTDSTLGEGYLANQQPAGEQVIEHAGGTNTNPQPTPQPTATP